MNLLLLITKPLLVLFNVAVILTATSFIAMVSFAEEINAQEDKARDVSKEALKSTTEDQIRLAKDKNKRLQHNEVLDESSRFYYDGDNGYPGIVINKVVFPAVVKDGNRFPGCIVEDKVIEGVYDRKIRKVVCRLSSNTLVEQGETIIVEDNPQQSKPSASRTSQVKNTATAKKKTKSGKSKTIKKATPESDKQANNQYKRSEAGGDNRGENNRGGNNRAAGSNKAGANKRVTNKVGVNNNQANNNKGLVLEVNAFRSKPKFGVRAGTWARVFLPRSVSSSEPANIELELVEEIEGRHKNVPAGTIFFTKHRINPATQRLDMQAVLMVLPDGSEYSISATIHSSGMTAGLAGAVITHTNKVASTAVKRNILDSTAQVIAQNGNPAAAIAGNVATEVLDAQENALPTRPGYSVQVASQEGLIRFGRSF